MDKTKVDPRVENEKWPDKDNNLTREEILRRLDIFKTIRENKSAGIFDFISTLELIYIAFIPYLGDRNLVQNELKNLQEVLYDCQNKMTEIMEKSRSKRRYRKTRRNI